MNRVTICENVYEPSTWETHEGVADVRKFLTERFIEWPETARIYHNYVAESGDVTPHDEGSVERLGTLEGHFYIVVYPEGIELIIAIIAIAVAALAIGLSFLLRPSASPNIKNQQQRSPNNELSDRQNQQRPNQRIPDIMGQVWAVPDLIEVPYRVFINNQEVEYSYMCIGVGAYEVSQVRDDTTPIEQISGSSAEVYAPFTSPNTGDAPQLRIGAPINEPVYIVKRSNAVNGQLLRAPNEKKLKGNANVSFVSPDSISHSGSDADFTNFYTEGQYLTLSNATAVDPAGIQASVSLNGKYLIVSVSANTIVLSNPAAVNANWSALAAFSGGASTFGSPLLVGSGDGWIGPFVITENNVEQVWCNFVAESGLYEIDKKANQIAMSVSIEFEVTKIDSKYNAVGGPQSYFTTLTGAADTKDKRGVTLKAILPLKGACRIRARRTSNTDLRDGYSVVDKVQWRDAYSIQPVTGDGTFVQNVEVTGRTIPWDFRGGINANYFFGEHNQIGYNTIGGFTGRPETPVMIAVVPGKKLTITYVSGSVGLSTSLGAHTTDNGKGYLAGGVTGRYDGGATANGVLRYPSFYMWHYDDTGAVIDADLYQGGLCGCFADENGNVVKAIAIGNGATFTVPEGATRLQLGINDIDCGDNYSSFIVSITADLELDDLGSHSVAGTVRPWSLTAYNTANFSISDTGSTAPVVVSGLQGGEIIIIKGSDYVEFVFANLADPGGNTTTGNTAGYPTVYTPDSYIGRFGLFGAFTDADGNVVQPLAIGYGGIYVVPFGATQLQLGCNASNYTGATSFHTAVVQRQHLAAGIGAVDFGNVTTIQAVTWPTQDALAIKERKLNCLVTRKLPTISGMVTKTVAATAQPWKFTAGINAAYDFGEHDGTDPELVTVVAGDLIKISSLAGTGQNIGKESGLGVMSTLLNGWGANGHVGDYEGGVDQGHSVPLALDSGTTYAYTDPDSVFDGNPDSAAFVEFQHTHKYAGCVWKFTFPTSGIQGITLRILSEVTAAILTLRSAGIWYSVDNGTNWIQVYNSASRDKQWDVVNLPQGTDPNNVQVMAFADSHDDMGHYVYEIQLTTHTIENVIGSRFPSFYMAGSQLQPLELCGAFADNSGNVIEPIAIGPSDAIFVVPIGATKLQLGINDNLYSNNIGSISVGVAIITASSTFGATLAPTKNAADIFCFMALAPFVGNRSITEIDIVGIYTAIASVQSYFKTRLCAEFCFTFDDYKVSFEESAADIAAAVFCTAYRRGSILSLFFERTVSNSSILFNHRNKIPGSETRTVAFGTANENDGLEIDYIDPHAPGYPENDTQITLYFPEDQSAVDAKKITLIGVRNNVQAWILGWRLFQKLLYQNATVQFEATQEAAVLVPGERVLIADNTRPDVQDGQVLEQIVLELKLSQKVTFAMGLTYTIFLQLYDGTVEAIAITAGSTDHHVVLAGAPSVPLVLDDTKFAKTTYLIVSNTPSQSRAFLLAEKAPQEKTTYQLKAVNYDDRYYDHDQDFATGIIEPNTGLIADSLFSTGYPSSGAYVPPEPIIDTNTTDPNVTVYRFSVDGV